MTSYRLYPAARRDLSRIWDFTVEHWDERQAENYVFDIRLAIERIAADPSRGRRCDEIRDGYRKFGIGSHLIFFVETDSGIDVARILHQRMDPTLHM